MATWLDGTTTLRTSAELESRLRPEVVNVKAPPYNAVGNGTTNDRAAIQAAIDSVASTGGTVYLPPGNYAATSTINVPSGVHLMGAGPGASSISATANVTVLSFSGANSANHVQKARASDLSVYGNGRTISVLVSAYYCDRLSWRNVNLSGVVGRLLHGVEFWDSDFDTCRFDNGGTTGVPAVHFQNTATEASSTDNVNNLRFTGCTWESFVGGALWAERNSGTGGSVNNIRLWGCKMESLSATGTFLRFENVIYSSVRDTLFFAGGGTSKNLIELDTCYYNVLSGLTLAGNSSGAVRAGIVIEGSGHSEFDPIFFELDSVSVSNIEFVSSPINVRLGMIESDGTSTPMYSGTLGSAFGPGQIRRKSGIPSDTDFPDVPPDGTLALDSTNHRLYIRDGGVWKYAALT